ncbi:thiol-disulfide oxidoreductase DCC family protein [Henriciella mobilis]|uniref:thiol-disulfide oxidoreductase DCC family protein n=1 Tax=Henriciella mobilis TaxID=2305467 RepID=UPI001F2609E9|nr:DUF393 domain-containing protein [Henriciella mobilis]
MPALNDNSADGKPGPPPKLDNWLLYDGECPFCSRYVQLLRIRETAGPLRLIDARNGGPELKEALAEGLDLDEGMVLKVSDRLYHGDDCVHMLALLSAPKGLFSRFNSWVFKSRLRSALIYPVLRTGRNITLRLLGRRKLQARNG